MTSLMQAECFVADAMLGKLVRWLRVMGIDVVYDPDTTDAQLLQCAEREGRILLTRDRALMRRVEPDSLAQAVELGAEGFAHPSEAFSPRAFDAASLGRHGDSLPARGRRNVSRARAPFRSIGGRDGADAGK